MAKYYQDFVGLNTFAYDPNFFGDPSDLTKYTSIETLYILDGEQKLSPYTILNTEGVFETTQDDTQYSLNKYLSKEFVDQSLPSFATTDNPDLFNALMIKRNGPYGFPSWKQVRVSENPIIRRQKKNNIFTYIRQPGDSRNIRFKSGQIKLTDEQKLVNTNPRSYINLSVEPVVTDSYKPLELIGGINVYNKKTNQYEAKSVKLKTSFDNETTFFSNDEVNRYYETIAETDENYESLKELYLNGGLDDDSSPLQMFNLMTYKQTIWPKQRYAYLNRTRSRTYFVNKFWRDERTDRTENDVDNGFGVTVPFQSMWPLDVAADWATRGIPPLTSSSPYKRYVYYIGGNEGEFWQWGATPDKFVFRGFNTGDDTQTPVTSASLGGAGILMNSYSQFSRAHFETVNGLPFFFNTSLYPADFDNVLSSSCYYSSRHTLNPQASVASPSGMDLNEVDRSALIPTASLFEGLAAWDAGVQSGKTPFYDSYDEYARNIRIKGKGYSTVPEFRISSHVAAYETLGVTEELEEIFEISGALRDNTTTKTDSTFYTILNTSDFLKSFDLIKKDHEDFTKPSILTLKCKAIKKFLPYEGFYPAQRTAQLSQQFYSSYGNFVQSFEFSGSFRTGTVDFSFQALQQPLFAPGALFNTIKSGVACDYPIIYRQDEYGVAKFENAYETGSVDRVNVLITGSSLQASGSSLGFYDSIFSDRVPFEALVEPERFLANKEILLNEPHPFGLGDLGLTARWDGTGDDLYVKMANNFLAETPEFFLKNQNFTSLSSLESSNPEFGNAISGSVYLMRVKMYRSRTKPNDLLDGFGDTRVMPPQDLFQRNGLRESLTMYSRPSAFGPPTWAGGSGSFGDNVIFSGSDSMHGYNFPYTPPYYHGEAWCDLVFAPTETRKYSLNEILSEVREYPYYSRFWWPGENDAWRDLVKVPEYLQINPDYYRGPYRDYGNSPWRTLPDDGLTDSPKSKAGGTAIERADWANDVQTQPFYIRPNGETGPQHPSVVNFNAMQIDSSVNLFGKGIMRKRNLQTDGSDQAVEVFSEATSDAKARWVIQPKFETPILNFNKYTNLDENSCTKPTFASESVPRGMWHQYGEFPSEQEGVYLQADDIPLSWMRGALNMSTNDYKKKIKSLADLCGFDKNPVKLGQTAEVKEISEAVVAVPFIEKDATRQFFTIPRSDIDDTISAANREVEPGVFVAGGPPKVGGTILDMVKKMKRYVFPPSMDFVRYNQIQPFAMYIFEFKHNLSKQDLADIWQNLPPDIGTSFTESEASISHELLANELLGGGTVIKDGKMDENAEGNPIPTNIQWMVFKVKRRAVTKYNDKVIQSTGRIPKPALQLAAEREEDKDRRAQGEDPDITYNWPYDFFSLVELVKLDAEVTFADIENDDKGNKTVKSIKGKPKKISEGIEKARGKK